MKGVVSQSVKDVIDALVSDGLVHAEKIGTSNYYWAFASAALKSKETQLLDLTTVRYS
jgi:transcription initiation factor IIE alpha subunit